MDLTITYPMQFETNANGTNISLPAFAVDAYCNQIDDQIIIQTAQELLINALKITPHWPGVTPIKSDKNHPIKSITVTLNDLIQPHWQIQASKPTEFNVVPINPVGITTNFYVGPDEWNDDQLTITDDGGLFEIYFHQNNYDELKWQLITHELSEQFKLGTLAGLNEILYDTDLKTVVYDTMNFCNGLTWATAQL